MNINITLNQLSQICHQYSQGMKSLASDDPCFEYQLFLEHHFGPSLEYIDESFRMLDVDLFKFQYEPLFYLHQTQPQDEITQWIVDTKLEIENKVFYVLEQLMLEFENVNPYVLYMAFTDELNIPEDTLTENDYLTILFEKFSEENFKKFFQP